MGEWREGFGGCKNLHGPIVLSNTKTRAQACTLDSAPRNSIADILASSGAAKLYGRGPLLAIVNQAMSDAAFRVLSLLAVPAIEQTAVAVTDIAAAMSWSERKAKYCLAQLKKLGVIDVSRKKGEPNVYRICSEVFVDLPRQTRTERVLRAKPVLHMCATPGCLKLCPLYREVCKSCAAEKRVERTARRVFREERAAES